MIATKISPRIDLLKTTTRQLSTTPSRKMKVIPYQARSDNWMYLIVDSSNQAAVVDPYDAGKISKAAKEAGVNVTSLITTHHHDDHSGGNSKFLSLHPDLKAYGGSAQSPGTNIVVKDGDTFTIGDDISVKCHHTPCHTQDSICFYLEDKKTGEKGVFTGDTLFLGGCGRFFEGTPEEMHTALTKLSKLPEDTVVYNGHEYTQGSAQFGLTIEPENAALKSLLKKAQEDSCTTGKSTIGDEKTWNVFMRLTTPEAKYVYDPQTVLKACYPKECVS
ncbi:hydroxyacylglutathione hydrolase, variant 1 [Cryptococcus amylolentus CBS 6039]|uniref:hydroxyacylglutathione hydrolase n=1 Tax=Cryptococcus amylolentus CBS 6039 TaxID=1295533 RepID=A0A1E3I074_9TREE|nr:hydroxyacylglutathione hydrolase, variant 1 [Cryptococcus amylolentus CBS 6039]ODN81725.1 hydroxyacylglutathione hydrolase, variant 1 [Cryptococcus amylolentus CBS 6039]